jgi:hypothetical protein
MALKIAIGAEGPPRLICDIYHSTKSHRGKTNH